MRLTLSSNVHHNLQDDGQNEAVKEGLADEEEELEGYDAESAFTKQPKGYGSDLSFCDVDTLLIRNSTSITNIGSVVANGQVEAMSGECQNESTESSAVNTCSPGAEQRDNRYIY